MDKLIKKFSNYHRYHTKTATVVTHFIGVPLVTFAFMVFLGWMKLVIPTLFSTNLAWVALFCLLVYYFMLDVTLAAITGILLIILCFFASYASQYGPTAASLKIFFSTLVIGIILQLVGHAFEKRKPAVFDNLSQALIAPMFIVSEFLFLFGYRHDLKIALKEQLKKHNTQKD